MKYTYGQTIYPNDTSLEYALKNPLVVNYIISKTLVYFKDDEIQYKDLYSYSENEYSWFLEDSMCSYEVLINKFKD